MAILTADHFIADTGQFCRVLAAGESLAAAGNLVTLGIRTSSPSTGFGYIQQGPLLGEKDGFASYKVLRFTEKPDPATAGEMIASGTYSWNSGMFICRAERMLNEFERQMPDLYLRLKEIESALNTPTYQTVLEHHWPRIAK